MQEEKGFWRRRVNESLYWMAFLNDARERQMNATATVKQQQQQQQQQQKQTLPLVESAFSEISESLTPTSSRRALMSSEMKVAANANSSDEVDRVTKALDYYRCENEACLGGNDCKVAERVRVAESVVIYHEFDWAWI
jgi:hypothetical protein